MCHKGMIVGEKGVSLDDLVYGTTKLMKQMDADGLEAIISAADTVSQALTDAKPLVDSTTKLIDQVCLSATGRHLVGVILHSHVDCSSVPCAPWHICRINVYLMPELHACEVLSSW